MAESYSRHDIYDALWTLIEPHTIGKWGKYYTAVPQQPGKPVE